ncbi:MAG: LamG domain-containing protein, partial [bacterium]
TNRLDLFSSSDLLFAWSFLATNLSTFGTNSIAWLDTNITGLTNRFYAAGNADRDTDADGLADTREQLVYQTAATNRDSDSDGLVDGYSGIVTTNTYPGGARTNGGAYVEGELSWHTLPTVTDTDDDGMGDGWEVSNGHNPTNWNDPPNVRGTVSYAGRQTGTVWVLAVTTSNSWATNISYSASSSAYPYPQTAYRFSHLESTNYWLKAWLDSNASVTTNATEARGTFTNTAVVITNRVLGADFALSDPDDNTNSLPDWWEVKYSGSTTNWTGSGDPDGDQYTNFEEYQANTDPTNSASHPWNINGTITYSGPQTGVIHVVACTSSNDWVPAQYTTNSAPGSYTITHLPPNAYYWANAWRDSNGDGSNTFWEAWGQYASNSVYLGPDATGVDITLADPDTDGDTLPDWWEVRYGLDPYRGGADNAAAWWKLDESSGTNVFDSTINANHGTLYNVSNAWTSGVISNGLLLDGTNDYVQVPNSVTLKPSAGVSVSLWLKPSRTYTNGTAYFLSKWTPGGSTGYSLGCESGALAFTICATGEKTLRYTCTLTSAVPLYVAGTFSSSGHRLYINGALSAETNYDWETGFATLNQGTNALRLGAASGSTPTNFFAGLLDDVRVYDRDLTSNEVHAVYELGADPDQDGLSNLDEYRFGSCPTNSDSDADAMLDGWEARNGLSPTNSADATQDTDSDGYLNIYEAKRGSDPTSSNSIPLPTHVITNGVITIQAMISSVTQDYAVVQVKAGIYTNTGNRDIDFGGKRLMLVSETGASNTVIDCQYGGRGFYFHSGETVLSAVKGLTITRGQANRGAGILCDGGSPWINDCMIVSNRPPQVDGTYAGLGVCVTSGTTRITSCTVEGNRRAWYGTVCGGGIALYDAALVSNTIVRGNDAFYGGGVYFGAPGGKTGVLSQCNIVTNDAVFGGGVWATNHLEISGGMVSSNCAASGGGLWCVGDTKVDGVIIRGNRATGGGGGIASGAGGSGKMPTLINVVVASNTAGTGGGIYHNPGGETPLILSNCSVLGNTASSAGGIYVLFGGLVVVGGKVAENTGLDVGGAWVFCNGEGPVEFTNVEIVGNRQTGAGVCGGLSIFKGTNDSAVILRGLLISNNCTTVSNGNGGFSIRSSASVTMEDCQVVGNTGLVSSVGGGYLERLTTGTATVARCRFERNVGPRGGGLYVFSQYGYVWVKECVFDGNTAWDSYGGLRAGSFGPPSRIESTAIVNNYAGTNGAAGYGLNAIVQNCTIAGNVCPATYGVGGLADTGMSGDLVTRNSVVWGNTGRQVGYGTLATYSCIQGGYTNNGSSNIITNNPGLLGGYRLLGPASPCLRAGTTTGLPATDINGDPWPTPSTPDIGCDGFAEIDADADGMNDEWEDFFFASLTNNGTADSDNDRLSNLDEYENGVNPLTSDTDGDFMPDSWEVARGLNPLDPGDAGGDWNGDGLSNLEELSREALAVQVTVADPNGDDDVWSVLLNGHVVATGGAGSPGSGVALIPVDTEATFTLQLVSDDGYTNNSDEYQVNFESVDFSSGALPWLPAVSNSPT